MNTKTKTIFSAEESSGSKGGSSYQPTLPSDPRADIPVTETSHTMSPPSTANPSDPNFGIEEESLTDAETKKVQQEIKKEELTETKKQEEKLENLTKNSQKVLFKCASFFPFDFFPDELSIEPTQINFSRKTFFLTSRKLSVPVKNISDVIVQTTPFFASLKIVDQFFAENSFQITYLKKNDAERARKIIQGLIIASKEGVDVSRIDPKQLTPRAEKLGHMRALE